MANRKEHAKMEDTPKPQETPLEPKEGDEADQTPNQAEEAPKKDLEALITEIKKGYEDKLVKQKESLEAKIKERDSVIRQLLTAEKPRQEKTIADEINERRLADLKKW